MLIAIVKERRPHEARVAASPDTVRKFAGLGVTVVVESGAGDGSNISNDDFLGAGATLAASAGDACKNADMVLKVVCPMTAREGVDEISYLRAGSVLVANLSAIAGEDVVSALALQGITSFGLELMPRISRAQSMDVLSSQSNLAGYKAALDAAARFSGAMPMMTTAAGTIPPARVFVFGAGVAGLQAIATAKRLGAVVTATDVRAAAKEQIESLGAKFIGVDPHVVAESSTGYGQEVTDERRRAQADAVRAEVLRSDIIITTALIPGKVAPRLVSADMVAAMRSGTVIVDIAAGSGGNVEGAPRDQTIVTSNGVTIIGAANLPARVPRDASAFFARNVLNFVMPMIDPKAGALAINWNDELIQGTLVTKDGQVVLPGMFDLVRAS